MKHYYCSTFSKGYAYKGLLLYNSLMRWDDDFHFFMICSHDDVKELFSKMNLVNATIIALSEIEKQDPELLEVKRTRNEKEYAWTSKASVMLYILNNFKEIDHITWLDGDTFFHSSPDPIFKEWGNYSIMLTEERWRKANKSRRFTKGIYNTGFMGFKRDENAILCLKWFRKKLIDWCYDKLENGLWSDQLYVNDWPNRFKNVGVIKNIGVNVGPYIIRGCKVDKKKDGIYVDDQKLIFYHSYGFRYYDGNEFDLCSYIMTLSDDVISWIYLPYVENCNEIMEEIKTKDKAFYDSQVQRPKKQFVRNYFNLSVHKERDNVKNICTMATTKYLFQGLALYNSLKKHNSNFHLWVLCIDESAYNLLEEMNLEHVTLISLANIKNEKLAKVEKQRQTHEFCWTLKAPFITYLMKNNLNLNQVLYIDADIFFFKGFEKIYEEWGDNSVLITKLWLGPIWAKKVGKYSAGLIGFKRDYHGMKCLAWWRRKCLNWCYDKLEKNRWGDQMYLDLWPEIFPKVKVSGNLGVNVGPWNIRTGNIVHEENNEIYFNDFQLICYHFSGFEVLNEDEFELCNRKKLPRKTQRIYADYVKEISAVLKQVKTYDETFTTKITSKNSKPKLLNHYVIGQGKEGL